MLNLDLIAQAGNRLRGLVHRTPLLHSAALSERLGAPVYLKLECLQKTGSFKVRGVINTLQQLSDEERSRGVISLSAGNHAQALAWGASRLGIRATIVMPANAAKVKVDATIGYGGEVVQTAGDLMQTALDLHPAQPLDGGRVRVGRVIGVATVDAQRAAVRRNFIDVEQSQPVVREDPLDRAELAAHDPPEGGRIHGIDRRQGDGGVIGPPGLDDASQFVGGDERDVTR